MTYLEKARQMLPLIQKGIQSLQDSEALQLKTMYPKWEDLVELGKVEYDAGYKFIYGEDLYSCIHANPTFQENWVPGQGTESLYTRIDETHAGTIDDPIPYDGNMALELGKYYSQDGVIYYCFRDTISPVYHSLSDLVGLYVEVATV